MSEITLEEMEDWFFAMLRERGDEFVAFFKEQTAGMTPEEVGHYCMALAAQWHGKGGLS